MALMPSLDAGCDGNLHAVTHIDAYFECHLDTRLKSSVFSCLPMLCGPITGLNSLEFEQHLSIRLSRVWYSDVSGISVLKYLLLSVQSPSEKWTSQLLE